MVAHRREVVDIGQHIYLCDDVNRLIHRQGIAEDGIFIVVTPEQADKVVLGSHLELCRTFQRQAAIVANGEGKAVSMTVCWLNGAVTNAVSPTQIDGGIVLLGIRHGLVGSDFNLVADLCALHPIASLIAVDEVFEVHRSVTALHNLNRAVLGLIVQEHAVTVILTKHSLTSALVSFRLTLGWLNDDAMFIDHLTSCVAAGSLQPVHCCRRQTRSTQLSIRFPTLLRPT